MADVNVVFLSIILGFFSLFIAYISFFRRKNTQKKTPNTYRELLNARLLHFKSKIYTDVPVSRKIEYQKKEKREERNINHDHNVKASKENKSVTNLSTSIYHGDYKFQQPTVKPFKSLQELYDWMPGYDESSIAQLKCRSIAKEIGKPKTIVCHDFKGGYQEDKYTQGYQSDYIYHLHYWNLIDTFVYFSHHFVTIPPPCWTNAAHIHGVKCFGTIITEWEDGAAICKEIFQDLRQVEKVVKVLVDLAMYYKFDGWLINIENSVEPAQIQNMISFVRCLTERMHENITGSEVIWYDSVLSTGELKWQNKLTTNNRVFFDVADGIFLNYNWSYNDLQDSIDMSGAERKHDIFVGVDVFGRGCFGGGGWNTYKAMQVIRELKLSAAIFAPGWVMEKFGESDFDKNNQKYWELLTSYLYPHYLSSLPITSFFCRGYGKRVFIDGEVVHDQPWSNLSAQSLQPTFSSSFYQLGPKGNVSVETVAYATTHAFNGGGCLQITGKCKPQVEQTKTVFRMFKVDVKLRAGETYHVSYTFQSSTDMVELFLMFVYKKKPVYTVFGGHSKDKGDKYDNSQYIVPEDQEENYEILRECNTVKQNSWITRIYNLTVKETKHLQEIRFACTNRGSTKEVLPTLPTNYEINIGGLKVCEISSFTRDRSSVATNLRCRNINITDDGEMKNLSFALLWDHTNDCNTKTPKCYDVFIQGIHEQIFFIKKTTMEEKESKEYVKNDRSLVFIGRSFVDSYFLDNVAVPMECKNGLKVIVQSNTYEDIREDLDRSGSMILKW